MEKDFKEYITPPVMLVVLLLAISLIFVFPVLNMIILGAILAYGIRPIARIIQSKLKFESISIILAMIAVLVPLILLIAYIVSVVSGVLTDFLASNPNFDINAVLTQASVYVPQLSPDNISTTIGDIAKYVANYLVGKIGSIANISLDLFILICSVFY